MDIEFHYEGGVTAFVKFIDRNKQGLTPDPITVAGEKEGITLEAALQWNNSYHENVLCFTNNIPQRDGGTHLAGFRAALTRTVNHFATESGVAKKEKVTLTGDDASEGSDLRALGQGSGSEILLADQGQARLQRGPAGGREPVEREARPVVRGAPE